MKPSGSKLMAGVAALLIGQAALQYNIFPLWQKNYAPKQSTPIGLSPEQLLLAFAGFREFMAGVLWVQADGFFHSGNYDAILPMLRLVTWLDPHQVDIYSTGAWHMAYNFTDESQRSDRRYIVPALKFLEEGIQNNPTIWDLYFEMGWTYYHKVQDPASATQWLAQANEFEKMITARRHILAHAYEKSGQLQKSVDTWVDLVDRAEEEYRKKPDNWEAQIERDTTRNNLEQMLIRIVRRYGDQPETQPPVNLNFDATVKVVRPRVILVEGKLGIPTIGTRVDVIVKNKGHNMEYDPAKLQTFSFEVDKDLTYMQDTLAVRESKFRRELDMSKDPKMYPFTADEYEVVISYNPRFSSPHVQDRLGWLGEGMTDDNYLVEADQHLKPLGPDSKPEDKQNPVRMVRKVITLTRDQILMRGSRDRANAPN